VKIDPSVENLSSSKDLWLGDELIVDVVDPDGQFFNGILDNVDHQSNESIIESAHGIYANIIHSTWSDWYLNTNPLFLINLSERPIRFHYQAATGGVVTLEFSKGTTYRDPIIFSPPFILP